MKRQIAKITLFGLVAAALATIPAVSRADNSTNTPAAAPVKKHGTPFHGKVTAVDTAAMTLTAAAMTLNITSETKITKDSKPAMLSDIAVGDTVRGAYKTDDAGKLNATTIRDGVKPNSIKKKKADTGVGMSTNSVPN